MKNQQTNMCGLIGHISKKEISDSGQRIIEQYQDQHERGTKGFGLMEISKTDFIIKRATEPTKALLDVRFSKTPIALFHHRQPTSTDNKLRQTHPLKITHSELKFDYYVIHNGVITNSDELFKTHTEELGYVYETYEPGTTSVHTSYNWREKYNDSECFAIELARYLDGKEKEINIKGSAAFILVRVNKKTGKPDKIMWGRNDRNPIELHETKSGLLIASNINHIDADAVPDNTFEIIDLKELFKNKKMPKEIRGLIKTKTLPFKDFSIPKEPMGYSEKETDTKTDKTQSTIITSFDKEKKNELIDEYDDFEERTKGYPPRMKAYVKMSDRIMRDLWPQIEEICQEMAWGPVSDDEITGLVSDLKDTLTEKEEKSNKRIRPFYDRQEEKEEEELEKSEKNNSKELLLPGQREIQVKDPHNIVL